MNIKCGIAIAELTMRIGTRNADCVKNDPNPSEQQKPPTIATHKNK